MGAAAPTPLIFYQSNAARLFVTVWHGADIVNNRIATAEHLLSMRNKWKQYSRPAPAKVQSTLASHQYRAHRVLFAVWSLIFFCSNERCVRFLSCLQPFLTVSRNHTRTRKVTLAVLNQGQKGPKPERPIPERPNTRKAHTRKAQYNIVIKCKEGKYDDDLMLCYFYIIISVCCISVNWLTLFSSDIWVHL